MSVAAFLINDSKPNQAPERIGCDYDEFVKLLDIFANPEYKVDDELIYRIDKLLNDLGTAEDWEIETILDWLKLNKGSSFHIHWD